MAGVSGNGQRELAECLAGLREATDGEALLGGRSLLPLSVQERLQAGLSFIPEERNRHGTIGSFSVAENAILQRHGAPEFLSGPFLDFRRHPRVHSGPHQAL